MSARAELIRILQGVEHHLLETPAGGWALVVPLLGARVLGAGLDGRNAFSACCRGELRVASADGTGYHLQIERRVEVRDLPGTGRSGAGAILLRIRHCLRNLGRTALPGSAGLWGILQLPCQPEGTLLLPDLPYRSYFGALPDGWARRRDGRLELRAGPGQRYKIGQRPPGPAALLAHRRPEGSARLEVALRFPCSPEGPYLDGPLSEPGSPGDALQAYNSPLSGREAFCELESHAPAAILAPGQTQQQTVEIEVRYGA